MTIRKGKICATMPESGDIQPGVDGALAGRAIGGKAEVAVINREFGFFDENEDQRGPGIGDVG